MFFDILHKLQTKFPIATILADFDVSYPTSYETQRLMTQIIPSADVTFVLSELVEALSFGGHQPIVCPLLNRDRDRRSDC
jgi:hypothetical protein